MKTKTFLFFSIEAGIAHMTRSLSIAEELEIRGHRVVFAVHESRQKIVRERGIETISVAIFLDKPDMKSISKFRDVTYLFEIIKSEIKVINDIKPDVIVVDFRLTSTVSAAISQVPTVFITGSGGLPYGCYLPNPGYPMLLHKLTVKVIQKIIWLAKKPYLEALYKCYVTLGGKLNTTELFTRMIYIVPEFSGYLPPVDDSLKINYVGPIFWPGFDQYKPKWLDKISPDGKTVYLSFGGTGYDAGKLVDLSQIFTDSGYRVIISASIIADVTAFPKNPQLFVARFLPGSLACSKVDVVVCHGGYGTMMQAVLNSKPVVSIPFNPDQLLHGLRLQELGMGKCLVNFDLYSTMRLDWDKIMNMGKNIPNSKVLEAVKWTFANKNKVRKAQINFQRNIEVKGGADIAASVIEKMN